MKLFFTYFHTVFLYTMSKEKKFDVALSTIAGSSFPNILKVFKGQRVDDDYKLKKINAMLVSALAEPFRWWENLRYGSKVAHTPIPENPVFILGHWRSGTTLLHNMICQDPQFAYVTTYHGIFPNQLLGGKWMFKNLMSALMPEKRASDNVKLSPDFPQEEEFGLGNMHPYSFYNFWFFPHNTFEYYEKYIRFNNVDEHVKKEWIANYKKLMQAAMCNLKRSEFVSKNPPHTGRIKILLEAFPNAKFIYIYRNPVTVFESTKKLILSTIPPLRFQNTSDEWVEETVFELYKRLVNDYEETKHLIPQGNLVEVKFEAFEKDTVNSLSDIYKSLSISGFDTALPYFRRYADSQKKYTKNTYSFSKEKLDLIMQHWGFSMEQYGYSLPEGMVLV
jgi:hypothetical protein